MPQIAVIHNRDSLDFVRQVFAAYNAGRFVALVAAEPGGDTFCDALAPYIPKERVIPEPGRGWLDVHWPLPDDERPAQIVFSSGTEGRTKAFVLRHRALADVAHRLNAAMQLDKSVREYVAVPVTHSFGLGRCRAVAVAGGKCYLPENGFDAIEFRRMLAADQINAISLVPTLLRALLKRPESIGILGEKVRWIEIGTQHMSAAEKVQMRELFPHARILLQYGLTEAPRTSFLIIDKAAEEHLDSVGQTHGHTQVRISDSGRIQIRGPHLADGQLQDGELIPLCGEDGWFETKDLGSVQDGYLYYQGRSDDLINCGGIKVDPELLQQRVAESLDAEQHLAICGIPDSMWGQGFFVAIDVQNALETIGIRATSSIKIQQVKTIPCTVTGKVQRRQLAMLYQTPTAALQSCLRVSTR